jgi:hypothetical protein
MYSLLSSNYDILRSRVVHNRCFEHIPSMKDNQRKGFLSLCMDKCLLRERKTMNHLFCAIKYLTTFFKRIFLYSYLSNIYIFALYEYTSHLLTYTSLMYIFIYKTISSFSRTAQHSTEECKWTSMISDRLPGWILCNHHLLIHCLSNIFYLFFFVYINTYDKVKKQFVSQ